MDDLCGPHRFPLFAFELVQGYMHTHDLRRYARRLLVLAVISEIPFDMVAGGTFFYIWHQNVAWTLLAGLGTCYCADHLTEKDVTASKRALYALGLAAAVALPYLLMTDYDRDGVLLILLFWFTRKGGAVNGLIQVAAMIVSGMGLMMPVMLLSGMIFPIESMPAVLQWISNIIPARWYIQAVKKVMIEGLGMAAVWHEALILSGMAALLIGLSLKKFKERLE